MLPKAQRCFEAREISLVYRKGRRVRADFFACHYLPRESEKRMLIIVSKKVSPHAVKRNLLKRRFSSLLQKNWEALPNGFFIFALSPECAKIPYTTFTQDFQKFLTWIK